MKTKIDTNKALNAGMVILFLATVFALLNFKPALAVFLWIVCSIFFFIRMSRTDEQKKTKKIDELKEAFEAGREYQAYKENANLEEKSWEYTFEKWYGRTYDKS